MNSQSIARLLRLNGGARQVTSFAAIGVVSTLAYVVIYAWLRASMPAGPANVLALLLTAIGNTAANRRLTFDVRGRRGLARDHAAGLTALGVALVITSASVAAMDAFAPHRGRLLEITVLVGANAAATLVRFLLLRAAIDRRISAVPGRRPAATLSFVRRLFA